MFLLLGYLHFEHTGTDYIITPTCDRQDLSLRLGDGNFQPNTCISSSLVFEVKVMMRNVEPFTPSPVVRNIIV